MTQPMGGSPGADRSQHIDIDELADFAEGLLSPDRSAVLDEHLSGCATCRSNVDALAEVSRLLAGAPAVSMPDDIFARLQGTLADEQRLREAERRKQPGGGPHAPESPPIGTGRRPFVDENGRPTVRGGGRFPKPNIAEHFTDTAAPRRGMRARFAGAAVAAAMVASAAGFGGYVLSAASGTAEPPADRPIVAQNRQSLASSAASAATAGLDPYRFTKAWMCARKVTDGRINGIRSTVLDGRSGYLVFLRSGPTVRAVFVHGCDSGTPQAGPTVTARKP